MNEADLRELGWGAYQEGDFDLAASYYKQLLKILPYDYQITVKLGSVLFLQSNFNACIQVYTDAIAKLEEQKEEGELLGNMHISLAEVYLELHRIEESQAHLEMAEQAAANPAFLCEARGRGHHARGEYDKALAAYEEYINLIPDDQDGYLGLAKANEGLKQYDQAAEALKNAKALGPKDYWVEIALGNLAMNLENYSSALEHYKIAQILDPRKPAVTLSIGQAYLMMKDYDNAGKMFSRALERRPNDAYSMYNLAQVEILAGNERQAIALLKSAIIIDPSNHSFYTLLSQAQVQSGKLIDAVRTSLQARKRFVKKGLISQSS